VGYDLYPPGLDFGEAIHMIDRPDYFPLLKDKYNSIVLRMRSADQTPSLIIESQMREKACQ